jgi:hypothetical protein
MLQLVLLLHRMRRLVVLPLAMQQPISAVSLRPLRKKSRNFQQKNMQSKHSFFALLLTMNGSDSAFVVFVGSCWTIGANAVNFQGRS